MIPHAERLHTFSDSLIEERRIAKRPMAAWIETLAAPLRGSTAGTIDADALASIQNTLALILLYHCGANAAAASCRRQIRWANGIGRSDLMVQPLINLARIDRFGGDALAAARRLDRLVDAAAGHRVSVEGLTLQVAAQSDRDFIAAVTLVERFHLALADAPAAVRAIFDTPAYRALAAKGGSLFAEQRLQAGLVHGLADIFAIGLDALTGTASRYNGLVARYYRAAWASMFDGDGRAAESLARGMGALAASVLASGVAIDHRFLRLVFAVARLADRNNHDATGDLFAQGLALADRLDDLHYRLIARHHLGWTGEALGQATAAAGYRTLRGVPLMSGGAAPPEIGRALDALVALVEAGARTDDRSTQAIGPSLAA